MLSGAGYMRMKTHLRAVRLYFGGSIQTQGKDKLISDCDSSLSQQQTEMLKRVMASLKFLKWRHAFRANTKTFGTPNNGTYQRCFELLRQFKPLESISHFVGPTNNFSLSNYT